MRVLATMAVLAVACAPKTVAHASCTNEALATGDPWSCTVTGALVDRPSSLTFDTESRNQVAQVKLALTVKKGTLRVGYQDLAGAHVLTVTPDAPASVAMQTRLLRDSRAFILSFEPVGKVEGLSGTVAYSTP